ncbi:MAG: Ig-like protein domain-containing protein [Candidatus Amesbacteria bacterium GW2011_GWB1_47_19]|nr:MAG: Ig-like protein domain-containing protein [Candidatus Amesbacteria bacterium GW2011_GWA1_44_24]KKU31810.1 MAG: Ig-like protein domain-containing protein [Candidatus Amesbacteria bacterium GW2011_GWC1_46_24]KKU66746.1 MAG: Ig-like protein domain-containing protein [Candidatus Amesbacteria bacterium GW2011_GWB1_47_19]OGD05048.1 MAG: hypothetical protein A2379_00545 [Candidatus Amesbacteria bacterium RIFOXYB1_FULL_47_13]HBC73112.1 hypothetical protein [Candidatus Amesbacteria bacterium]
MKPFYYLLLPFTLIGFVVIKNHSYSYFSDSAVAGSNTFTASAVFPLSPTPIPSVTPTPPIANHLVISEVQINGANANQDFIEIYNPTDASQNLAGWNLRKRTSNGTESSVVLIGEGKSIPAHGFFLWSNNQSDYNVAIGADVYNTNNISENNSVALLDTSDLIIDQIAWGNGTDQFVENTPYTNSPATSQSLERKAYSGSTVGSMTVGSDADNGNGFDSNNNSVDFILRNTSDPQNSLSSPEIP